MSDLIIPALAAGCCDSVVPPPAPPETAIIVNDGWFPDIALAGVRAHMRVRDNLPAARLRDALLDAIISVGNDLAAWGAEHAASGIARLADVPAPALDGESRLVILYRRAVFALAKADLVERQRDVDTSQTGDRRIDALDPTIGELRRDAAHAVRDILARPRTCIELI